MTFPPRVRRKNGSVALISSAASVVTLAAFGAALTALSGCGSGVANALPSAVPAVKGVPSGPVLGYIFSVTDGTLRPMLGVRGSAQVGQSIVPAGVYVAGDASTAGSAGLLEDAGGSLYAFNLPASQPIHVADNFAGHAQVVFSSSGATAIAYAVGGSKVLLISGLPLSPQVQTLAVPSSTQLVSAAVSNAGTVVIETGSSVGVLSLSGAFSRLASVSSAGGLNFIPGSDDLLIADQTANTVSVLRNVSSAPVLQPLNVAGVNQPVAVAASLDKRWAIVANSGDQNVLRVDLTTGTATTALACACQPTQLASLAGGGGFRVNSLGNGPIWTLDVSGSSAQFLFVPAIQ